jgi:AcrR family transcriptional regulator
MSTDPTEKASGACRCPRPYRLGKRREAMDRKRRQVLQAARQLLKERGFPSFTMEAVARQAGVTRQTVHNQFGSRTALLEALCDFAALDGGLDRLPEAFQQAEPLKALERYIELFVAFWAADEGLTRRMHGLAALDPEFAAVIDARQERRRGGLQVLVSRIKQQRLPDGATAEAVVDTLFMLTSFESFAALARVDRRPEEIARILTHLARAAVGSESDPPRDDQPLDTDRKELPVQVDSSIRSTRSG